MASGSTYTVSGGTTMTGVVAGDVIDDADFNNARANVDKLLGTPADVTLGTYTASNTYGINQGGAGVNAASAGGLVYADNATGGFKRLQDDVQALCAFYGITVRTNVGSDVTSSTVINATTWTNLMLNIQDVWNARFDAPSGIGLVGTTKSYSNTWTATLTNELSYTFASEAACRAWFNMGNGVGYNARITGSGFNTQTTNWQSLLSSMSTVNLLHDTCEGSSGTNAGKGFYEMGTSYTLLWTKFGSGAYASNNIKIYGKVNSTTNPTVVTIKGDWADPYTAAAAAADGAVGPDGVPGTGDDAAGYTDAINDGSAVTTVLTAIRKNTDESTFGVIGNPTMAATNISVT